MTTTIPPGYLEHDHECRQAFGIIGENEGRDAIPVEPVVAAAEVKP